VSRTVAFNVSLFVVYFILSVAFARLALGADLSHVKVLSVHDGDTFTIQLSDQLSIFGSKISVRVKGIDAPEIHGKGKCEYAKAQEAKHELETLLNTSKNVTLKSIARDKYFRLLADVYADDHNVSDILLSKKLAYPYNGKTKAQMNWCRY
jgi:micrococcal nuclease